MSTLLLQQVLYLLTYFQELFLVLDSSRELSKLCVHFSDAAVRNRYVNTDAVLCTDLQVLSVVLQGKVKKTCCSKLVADSIAEFGLLSNVT